MAVIRSIRRNVEASQDLRQWRITPTLCDCRIDFSKKMHNDALRVRERLRGVAHVLDSNLLDGVISRPLAEDVYMSAKNVTNSG